MILQNCRRNEHRHKVDHSDLSKLLGNDSETTGQTHQTVGHGEGRTSAHGYIQ